MNYENKILIGGQALVTLGSSRSTNDTDYLVNDESTTDLFIFDKANNIDYINANGHAFFKAIFNKENGNKVASPASLLELKAFAFAQHCRNFKWQKADDAEYDIKFLVRNFKVSSLENVTCFLDRGALSEINTSINSTK